MRITGRVAVRAAICALGLLVAFNIGLWGVVGAAGWASLETTENIWSPGTTNFAAPVNGFNTHTAGATYAVGVGSMSQTDVDANEAQGSNGKTTWDGLIEGVDFGLWWLDVSYDGSVLAKSHYVPTGIIPSHENYSVTSFGFAEIAGDFTFFDGRIVSARHGFGGATNPYTVDWESFLVSDMEHADGVTVSAAAPDGNGMAVETGVFGGQLVGMLFGQNVAGEGVPLDFILYARALTWLINKAEEDVSLTSTIEAGTAEDFSPTRGWYGTLDAYDVWGPDPDYYWDHIESWLIGN